MPLNAVPKVDLRKIAKAKGRAETPQKRSPSPSVPLVPSKRTAPTPPSSKRVKEKELHKPATKRKCRSRKSTQLGKRGAEIVQDIHNPFFHLLQGDPVENPLEPNEKSREPVNYADQPQDHTMASVEAEPSATAPLPFSNQSFTESKSSSVLTAEGSMGINDLFDQAPSSLTQARPNLGVVAYDPSREPSASGALAEFYVRAGGTLIRDETSMDEDIDPSGELQDQLVQLLSVQTSEESAQGSDGSLMPTARSVDSAFDIQAAAGQLNPNNVMIPTNSVDTVTREDSSVSFLTETEADTTGSTTPTASHGSLAAESSTETMSFRQYETELITSQSTDGTGDVAQPVFATTSPAQKPNQPTVIKTPIHTPATTASPTPHRSPVSESSTTEPLHHPHKSEVSPASPETVVMARVTGKVVVTPEALDPPLNPFWTDEIMPSISVSPHPQFTFTAPRPSGGGFMNYAKTLFKAPGLPTPPPAAPPLPAAPRTLVVLRTRSGCEYGGDQPRQVQRKRKSRGSTLKGSLPAPSAPDTSTLISSKPVQALCVKGKKSIDPFVTTNNTLLASSSTIASTPSSLEPIQPLGTKGKNPVDPVTDPKYHCSAQLLPKIHTKLGQKFLAISFPSLVTSSARIPSQKTITQSTPVVASPMTPYRAIVAAPRFTANIAIIGQILLTRDLSVCFEITDTATAMMMYSFHLFYYLQGLIFKQRRVRIELRGLMTRSDNGVALVPSPKCIADFESDKQEKDGPQLNNFWLDLAGSSTATDWNRRAAYVFADYFVEQPGNGSYDRAVVREVFCAHLPTVQKRYKLYTVDADEKKGMLIKAQKENEAKAKLNRQRNLRHRRAEICCVFHERDPNNKCFQRFHTLWESMPKEACSEDEAFVQGGRLLYRKQTPAWHSSAPEVVNWFKMFDLLHMSTCFQADGRRERGWLPQNRLPADPEQKPLKANYPKHLPSNFYDKSWLETLDNTEQKILDIQKPVDLTFDARYSRLAGEFADKRARDPFAHQRN
ncbi:hypothetical protein NP233_g3799 [Leucocoprinus birnbaumii]|uniref:Uncharacterized protein n=1 Tax=Leucocoprinus birnbaumii TaxID=56174 RepID=A0AAD5VZT2_9AGAR|nr:hypothetical protein NP233_g3799 [Leucocoprinus birnbaumii]